MDAQRKGREDPYHLPPSSSASERGGKKKGSEPCAYWHVRCIPERGRGPERRGNLHHGFLQEEKRRKKYKYALKSNPLASPENEGEEKKWRERDSPLIHRNNISIPKCK